MALKKFNPTSPGQRFKTGLTFDEITKARPEKALTEPLKKTGGRDNRGRITSRFIGGGEPEGLVAVELRDTVSGALERLDTEGAFVAIGHSPATELFGGHLRLDRDGYIEVETGTTRTSVPGVFACGDVMDKIYRQAVTAAGTGCMAALDAEKFLAEADFEGASEPAEAAVA